MKLKFGKYKGDFVSSVAITDPGYLLWLYQLPNLEMSLKKYIELIKEELEKARREQNNKYYNDRLQEEYEDSVKYEQDIEFWARVSPYATYDHIKRYNINVSDSEWKTVMYYIKKREG